MKKKLLVLLLSAVMAVGMMSGCGAKDEASDSKAEATKDVSVVEDQEQETVECELEDGTYTAEFNTDSGMFHVNEADDGKGVLTVEKRQDDHSCVTCLQEDREPLSGSCRRCTEGWSKTDPADNRRSYIL